MRTVIASGANFDRYQVVEEIGQGGMAVVYKVRHVGLDREFALKLLKTDDPDTRARFAKEGRLQSSLRHPNIVAVTDVVEVDGVPGLVMEYVAGPTLTQWAYGRRLELTEIEPVLRAILAGVGHAHQRGLVHRDLKPGNVLMDTGEDSVFIPKITDFGLAKAVNDEGSSLLTRSDLAIGTPAYMAPEQIRNPRTVDQRADMFAIGAIMYQLVCGQLPFKGDNPYALMYAIMAGKYVPPDVLRRDLPAVWLQAIRGLLTTDPNDRIASCPELKRLLWPNEVSNPKLPRPPDVVSAVPRGADGGARPPRPQAPGLHVTVPPEPVSESKRPTHVEGVDEVSNSRTLAAGAVVVVGAGVDSVPGGLSNAATAIRETAEGTAADGPPTQARPTSLPPPGPVLHAPPASPASRDVPTAVTPRAGAVGVGVVVASAAAAGAAAAATTATKGPGPATATPSKPAGSSSPPATATPSKPSGSSSPPATATPSKPAGSSSPPVTATPAVTTATSGTPKAGPPSSSGASASPTPPARAATPPESRSKLGYILALLGVAGVLGVLFVAVVVGLGAWWWTQRSVTMPADAPSPEEPPPLVDEPHPPAQTPTPAPATAPVPTTPPAAPVEPAVPTPTPTTAEPTPASPTLASPTPAPTSTTPAEPAPPSPAPAPAPTFPTSGAAPAPAPAPSTSTSTSTRSSSSSSGSGKVSVLFTSTPAPTAAEVWCDGGYRLRLPVAGGRVVFDGVPSGERCRVMPKGNMGTTAWEVHPGDALSCDFVDTTMRCR